MANIDFSFYLRDYTGDFIIPDDVTSIEENAFYDCAGLTAIEIPNSVTRIGRCAFSGCAGLTSIVIPDSVTEIDDSAFSDCKNLTSVTIGNNVTSIGERAFYGCKSLTSIVWNARNCADFIDSNTPFHYFDRKHPYREYMFFDIGNQITSFTFGKSVEHIPAFLCCGMCMLKTITLPNSVTSIGKGAFFGCKGIDSIKIPQGITDIRAHSFRDCVGLKFVTLSNNVESIEWNAFGGCTSLTSIELPDNITSIGSAAFKDCTSLVSIKIPQGVECIADEVFFGCKGLISIEIPDSVTIIGGGAFAGCENLTSILIPCSVESIGSVLGGDVFSGCSSLNEIHVANENTNYSSTDGVLFNKEKTTLLRYPQNKQGKYIIPDSVTNIEKLAFGGCVNLTSIIIPNTVTSIDEYAFCCCKRLNSVVIPDSVKRIVYGTFKGCKNLTSITIPNGVTTIENLAFYECSSLISVEISNSVTYIGYSAFCGCVALTSITIPKSVTTIEDEAFKDCTSLTSIIVPLGEEESFCKMKGLKPFVDIIRQTTEKRIQQQKQRDEYEQRLLQEQQRQKLFQDSNLFFDTETNGLPRNYKASVSNSSNWPRLVQIAWIVTNEDGKILKRRSEIIYPDGFTIPQEASDLHGITTERARREGKPLREVLDDFAKDLVNAKQIVCHNVEFDQHIVGAELYRMDMDYQALMDKPSICTMLSSTNFCAIPNPNGYDDYKWPKLSELYNTLFNRDFEDAHDALADITATKDCFFELKRRGII